MADFDGSGLDDLAVAVGTSTNAGDRQEDTPSLFDSTPDQSFRVGALPEAIAVGDWNGDTYPDLAVLGTSSGGISTMLGHVTLVCVSRAPYPKLAAYRYRMGWSFPWFSSAPSDFNFDFGVSFTAEQQSRGATYNFAHQDHPPEEAPGISAFALDDGQIFHTYSAYSRGLDPINGAYQLLDLAPKGRDEGELDWPMAWLRRHDAYDA